MRNPSPTPATAAAQSADDVALVSTWKVACDGGEGPLGHPRVWLSLAKDTGEAVCGYCDKIYRIDPAHAHDDH
ncbi:MAG: zinc-finger domain-containing protein [Cypionkella sp.]